MGDEDSGIAAEALFDQLAEGYDDVYGNNPGLKKALDQLNTLCKPGASVLDIGCGPGSPASYLANMGHNITGIDVSGKMIDYCKARVKGSFHKADMLTYEPDCKFDAVVVSFSLFQLSYRSTQSMLYKAATWLRPDGILVLGTIAAEEIMDDASQIEAYGYVECAPALFMERVVQQTFISTRNWLNIIQSTGLRILDLARQQFQPKGLSPKQNHMFITAQRTNLEPLFGPYPIPTVRRTPHALSQEAWRPFAETLTRHDLESVLEVIESNKKVLDVGSGHGELPLAIAEMHGASYSIEPNTERREQQAGNIKSNVHVRQGVAESLPFEDNMFDAVVALWILHYVHDLEASLTEMVRVVNPAVPNARLVIVQGAPDNEVVHLINKACIPLEGHAVDHQGLLLATAARVFTNHGFGDITLTHVDTYCNFPEEDLQLRCGQAAKVLTNLWYLDHPRSSDMQASLQSILREHFKTSPSQVGDQGVMLVARPARSG
ncbi:hypothetical protein F66182_4524 [Fusarium sp. NRRL 66182]|nr:hypothetical protein F66182_4524 [Fusarium sp. NRRL 66182]